jgi:threonylcarbamoyladenosine tRNA methylthiotransferase MtaB
MKVYLDTVGCRLNQSEIEAYARQFRLAGHELVSDPRTADLAVMNTCAVTAQAASDSRQKIRQMQRMGALRIVVTGCWSTLQPEAAAALPGVSLVIANPDKDKLVPMLLQMPEHVFDLEPVERQPLPGARMRTRAFIKAQDGCDNRCTFCVTTLARGSARSRTVAQVIADVQAAWQGGAQEVVLTGVHLGSWGQDLGEKLHLRRLVQAVLRETGIPRLRLSSLEPWDLDADFFELWQDERLCRHLHLPLQSGSAATLRRMARKTTPREFAGIMSDARSHIPDIAITTDIIVGFPGESETEFKESLEFVRAMAFAGGHVFTYSAREGTAAARMPGQVPQALRKQRNAQMRAIFAESAAAYRSAFSGQVLDVLWENAAALHADGWQLSGLTGNYLRVSALAPQRLWNQITPVRLIEQREDGFWGRLLEFA